MGWWKRQDFLRSRQIRPRSSPRRRTDVLPGRTARPPRGWRRRAEGGVRGRGQERHRARSLGAFPNENKCSTKPRLSPTIFTPPAGVTDAAPIGRRRRAGAMRTSTERCRRPPLRSRKQGVWFRRTGNLFRRTGSFFASAAAIHAPSLRGARDDGVRELTMAR